MHARMLLPGLHGDPIVQLTIDAEGAAYIAEVMREQKADAGAWQIAEELDRVCQQIVARETALRHE